MIYSSVGVNVCFKFKQTREQMDSILSLNGNFCELRVLVLKNGNNGSVRSKIAVAMLVCSNGLLNMAWTWN